MGGLHVSENIRLQRRFWVAERIGWGVLTLIVLAALLGLFGTGPLDRATAVAATGALRADYPRFARIQSPLSVTLRFEPPAGQARAQIWLEQSYLDAIDLKRITPEPESAVLGADRLTYVFALGEEAGQRTVKIQFEARGPGYLEGRMGVVDAGEVNIGHFFYP
jgi:hypothetical protein